MGRPEMGPDLIDPVQHRNLWLPASSLASCGFSSGSDKVVDMFNSSGKTSETDLGRETFEEFGIFGAI